MALNELFAAINMFNQSAKEHAVGTVLSQAREQMNQLSAANIKEDEKKAAFQQFSNDLALQLGQASGGNAALVEGIAGRFGLSAGQQADQAYREKSLQQQADLSREEMGARSQAQIMSAVLQEQKTSRQEAKQRQVQTRLYQQNFLSQAKGNLDAFEKANAAYNALSLENPVADSAVRNMLVKASGDVGAITEADREVFSGSPTLWANVRRNAARWLKGTLSDADRKDMREAITAFRESAKKAVSTRAKLSAGQMAANFELPEDEAMKLILPVSMAPHFMSEDNKNGTQIPTSVPGTTPTFTGQGIQGFGE